MWPQAASSVKSKTVQITKITRPLLSVTQMPKNGDILVFCKRDKAVVLNAQNQPLAVFKRKGCFYAADMKVCNPKFKPPFGGLALITTCLLRVRPPKSLKRCLQRGEG